MKEGSVLDVIYFKFPQLMVPLDFFVLRKDLLEFLLCYLAILLLQLHHIHKEMILFLFLLILMPLLPTSYFNYIKQ